MSDLSNMDFLMGTQSAPLETTTVVEQSPEAVSKVTKTVAPTSSSPEQVIRGMLGRPEIGEAMLLSLLSDAAGINMSDMTQAININQMLNPTRTERPDLTMQQALAGLGGFRDNVAERFYNANPAWVSVGGQSPFSAYVTEDDRGLSQEDIVKMQQYITDMIDYTAMESPEVKYYKRFLPAEMQQFREFQSRRPPVLAPSILEKMKGQGIPGVVVPNIYINSVPQNDPSSFIRQILNTPPTQSGPPVFLDQLNIQDINQ
tara:strand:- start:4961 stop:5737 length:777 start_codon:yes stop_codon:yes gene_type:complete